MNRRFAFVTIVLLSACRNKISGEVTVNGTARAVTGCRNGAVYNFQGVELELEGGSRLRAALTLTNAAQIVLLPAKAEAAAAAPGVDFSGCGTLAIENQSSTINSVRNVSGRLDLNCQANGTSFVGSVTFANCH